TPGSSGGSPKRSKLASHGACCEVEPAVPARSPPSALTLGSLTRRRQLLGWWYNRRGSSFHKFERVNGAPEAEPLAQAWSIESVRERVGSGRKREVPEAESRRSRPRQCVGSARAVGMRANARYPRPRVDARGRGSASVRHAQLGCAPTRGTRGRESTLEAEAVRRFGTRGGDARQREVHEAESSRSRPRQCVSSAGALGVGPQREVIKGVSSWAASDSLNCSSFSRSSSSFSEPTGCPKSAAASAARFATSRTRPKTRNPSS